jgi:hypothetical protein
MVETTVNKDCKPKSGNYKIGLARQRAHSCLDALAGAEKPSQKLVQRSFR